MQSYLSVRTILHAHEIHFKWTIENWSLSQLMTAQLRSQNFILKKIEKSCYLTLELGEVEKILNVHIDADNQLKKCAVNAFVVGGATFQLQFRGMITTGFEWIYTFGIVEQTLNDCLVIMCNIKYVTETQIVEDIVEPPDDLDEFQRRCSSWRIMIRSPEIPWDMPFVESVSAMTSDDEQTGDENVHLPVTADH